jgi:hypothetical protein
MPVIAQASNDPILVLIDRHKVAFAEWIEAVNHLSDMEAAIPSELQKGGAYCFEVEVVKTDDPRWTAANIRYNDIIIKADGIAIEARRHTNVAGRLGSNPEMCSPARPKTALWPDGEQVEDEDEEAKSRHHRDWNFYLPRNLDEALQKMAA